MIVCHDPKLVIWAPVKTATRSVRQFLENHVGLKTVTDRGWVKNGMVFPVHDFPRTPEQRKQVRRTYARYKFLITASNPYHRIASMYQMTREYPLPVTSTKLKCSPAMQAKVIEQETRNRLEAKNLTFEQWVMTAGRMCIRPMTMWMDSMDRVDGVIRSENIVEDLCRHTGIKGTVPLVGQSGYEGRQWFEIHTPATLDYTWQQFKPDFERFDYDLDFNSYVKHA